MTSAHGSSRVVVFVHGLWLHAESWTPWVARFREAGYEPVAASWPGDAGTVEATRKHPGALAGWGVDDVVEHVARQFPVSAPRPILIGHSFGGLVVQKLLGQGRGAAAIAIDPAPIHGVWQLPVSALRAAFPVLGNPLNYGRAVALTEPQFRYAFANAVPAAEAQELYARHAIPAPGRPLFQAATAAFNPAAATRVDVANATRGPLLVTAGSADHTVPPVLSHSTVHQYRHSSASTDFFEFAGRGHSLTIDSGWEQVADHCLAWLASKSL